MCADFSLDQYIPVVLAAGFGSRLRPLTNIVPKAAVPINNWAVAYHSIRTFLELGFPRVLVNTHYLASKVESEIRACLKAEGRAEDAVRFFFEPEILETGGGLVNIARELTKESVNALQGKSFFVVAGDVFSQVDVLPMIQKWEAKKNERTLGMMATRSLPFERPDVIWVDTASDQITGFGTDHSKDDTSYTRRLFTTHQIIRAEYVLTCPLRKESSRDLFYRNGLKQDLFILNYAYSDNALWHDIGDYSALANTQIKQCLSTSSLLKHCLILLSSEDLAQKKSASDPLVTGTYSSGDKSIFLSEVLYHDRPVTGIIHSADTLGLLDQDTDLLNLLSILSKVPTHSTTATAYSTSAVVSLQSPSAYSTPTAQSPQLPSSAYSTPAAQSLQPLSSAYSKASSLTLLKPTERSELLFSISPEGPAFTLPLSLPVLIPLELLSSKLITLGTHPLLPLYQSSNTFFLINPNPQPSI